MDCFDSGDYVALKFAPQVASENTTEVPLILDPIYEKYDTYNAVKVETQVWPEDQEQTEEILSQVDSVISQTKRESLIQALLLTGLAFLIFRR